ncbi:unnamed protein product [Calypogeia fissa]
MCLARGPRVRFREGGKGGGPTGLGFERGQRAFERRGCLLTPQHPFTVALGEREGRVEGEARPGQPARARARGASGFGGEREGRGSEEAGTSRDPGNPASGQPARAQAAGLGGGHSRKNSMEEGGRFEPGARASPTHTRVRLREGGTFQKKSMEGGRF